VLVIYEHDCEQHVHVIQQLTQLLQTHCNCQVLSEMTHQDEIRQSRTDFVLKQADVVLVVASTKLRDAWLAQCSNPDERHLPSVAELLLQRLREVVLWPRSIKLVAVRFDYTPEMTDIETNMALLPDMYELMRDIDRLLFCLRGANTSSRLLACCLPHDTVPDLSKLTQAVEVARQHYQQQQVRDDGHASSLFIEDIDMLDNGITTRPCVADNVVDNLPSKPTSGYVSAQTDGLQSAAGRGVVVPQQQLVQASDMRYNSTVADSSDNSDSARLRVITASVESLCIHQRISQINADYDNEPAAQHHSLLALHYC